jgi:hypothetical protein
MEAHQRLGVVEQELARASAKVVERTFDAAPPRRLPLMSDDFGETTVSVAGERVRVHLFVATLGFSRRPYIAVFPATSRRRATGDRPSPPIPPHGGRPFCAVLHAVLAPAGHVRGIFGGISTSQAVSCMVQCEVGWGRHNKKHLAAFPLKYFKSDRTIGRIAVRPCEYGQRAAISTIRSIAFRSRSKRRALAHQTT